jgi:hypothetical protein
MAYAKVSADNGINWLTSGVSMVMANPAVFLVMGLILAVIGLVPVLGGLALAILGPALVGGIVFAAREHAAGRPTDIAQLFQAFREPGKIGPMLLLCIPGVAGGFALLVVVMVFAASALIGGGFAALEHGGMHLVGALGGGAIVALLLALVIGLVMYSLQLFAVPRVMLDGVEPFAAMRESFEACRANFGAFVLYCAVVVVAWVVLGFVLLFIPLLGWLALSLVSWAVIGCATYAAWHQVYGDGAVSAPEPAPTTPEPPAA